MSSDRTQDPALGHSISFGLAERAGASVGRVEIWVDPDVGVPPHSHPTIDKTLEIVEGRLELLVGRRRRAAEAGEIVTVAPGTRHAYRNRGESVAHAICWVSPASEELVAFLRDATELGRAGRLSGRGCPRNPAGALGAAVLAEHYRGTVELGSPPLPPLVGRLLMGPLARIGRRRGFEPGAILGEASRQPA